MFVRSPEEMEGIVRNPKQREVRASELGDELEATESPGEIDAAESRWDPWLLALAKMAADSEARPN